MLGQLQFGALTVWLIAHAVLLVFVTVIVTLGTLIGIFATEVLLAVPALALTLPPALTRFTV